MLAHLLSMEYLLGHRRMKATAEIRKLIAKAHLARRVYVRLKVHTSLSQLVEMRLGVVCWGVKLGLTWRELIVELPWVVLRTRCLGSCALP